MLYLVKIFFWLEIMRWSLSNLAKLLSNIHILLECFLVHVRNVFYCRKSSSETSIPSILEGSEGGSAPCFCTLLELRICKSSYNFLYAVNVIYHEKAAMMDFSGLPKPLDHQNWDLFWTVLDVFFCNKECHDLR